MIRSFADKHSENLWLGKRHRFPMEIERRALVKLQLIHAAPSLDFLRFPPGDRLEALSGNRSGQYSIRINSQWRVCFRWTGADAEEVELCDYH